MCMCNLGVCTYVCTCTWNLEIVVKVFLDWYYFEIRSLTEPEASIWQRLASQETPGFPCFYSHSAGFTDACNGTEKRIEVLMLLQQALCQLSYLPSPLFIIILFYHWVIPPVLNYLILNPNNFLLPGWLLVLSLTCYIGLNHQFNFLQSDFLSVKHRLWVFYKTVVRTKLRQLI